MPATVLQFRTATSEEADSCCVCGVEFASPVLIQRRKDGGSFWCPNGHSQHYTRTSEQRLREELEAEKRKRQQAEHDAEWQRAEVRTARAQETKAKNELKKIKTRVNAGVCTCCNRTFQNLARHMQTKHSQ